MNDWIVVVDDEELSLTNARNLLKEQGMKVSCLRSGDNLLRFMENNEPDLILLDILMPDMDGFETFRRLRKMEEKAGKIPVPVIFLTGENDSETERRGLNAGASDFIRKPFNKEILLSRIGNTIANSKAIESLTEEATLDKLTGFLNKASGTTRISGLCAETKGALLVMDLDSFKLVNDLFGHDCGDKVLVAFADVVRRNVRTQDVVSRIGGDEFMGFFADMDSEDDVAALIQRLNKDLMTEADALMGEGHGVPLGISAGAVFTNGEAVDYQTLFHHADNSLYKVKQNGKHGYEIYTGKEEEEQSGDDLESELRRVTTLMEERGAGNGALLLGQADFTANYRYIRRLTRRYRSVACRLLFSLNTEQEGIDISEAVGRFSELLQNNLRRSDIIFRCRPNQFFILLPGLSDQDVQGVADRITDLWKGNDPDNAFDIRYAHTILSFEE